MNNKEQVLKFEVDILALGFGVQEFSNDSGSSQIFWLLKESELTPSNANILDGRYSVFGYVVENQELLADVKVGDIIESIRVVDGINNLVNPTYKVRKGGNLMWELFSMFIY